MEAKELQIGDLVQNTCGHKGRVIGFRYYTEDKSNEIVISYKGNDTTWSSPSLIEPIPLTEEILKANGFGIELNYPTAKRLVWQHSTGNIEYTIYNSKRCTNGYLSFLCIDKYNKNTLRDRITMYNLVYVHQLQHALRLCGLAELADNFKIEAS